MINFFVFIIVLIINSNHVYAKYLTLDFFQGIDECNSQIIARIAYKLDGISCHFEKEDEYHNYFTLESRFLIFFINNK